MRITYKRLLPRLFIVSALTTPFIPFSYGMTAEPTLPHETLAALRN